MCASKILINIKLLVLKITTLLFLPKWLFRHHECLCDKQRLYSALSYLAHDKFITTQRCLIISNISSAKWKKKQLFYWLKNPFEVNLFNRMISLQRSTKIFPTKIILYSSIYQWKQGHPLEKNKDLYYYFKRQIPFLEWRAEIP